MKFIFLFLICFNIFSENISIPVIYISDLNGNFFDIDKNTSYIDILKQIEYLKKLKNYNEPIILNNGSTFWSNQSIKHISSDEKGINFITELLKITKFDAITLGRRDFYIPKKNIDNISNDLNTKDIPFLLSNADCKNLNNPFCKIIQNKKYIIIERNNIKTGIISVVQKDVLLKTSKENIEGIDLIDEIETINKLTEYLKKEQKVNVVILLSQIETIETTPKKIFELSSKVKGVDIIISNELPNNIIKKVDENFYIVGSDLNKHNINMFSMEFSNENDNFILKNVSTEIMFNKKDEIFQFNQLDEKMNFYINDYKAKYNAEIVKINKTLSFNEYIYYFMNIIKQKTKAEIVIYNKKTFNSDIFPINKFTFDVLMKSITYNENVYTFEIKGALLEKFLKKYVFDNNLLFSGTDSSLKVNGRAIIPQKKYKIATSKFIINGGDNYFIDEFKVFEKEKQGYLKSIIENHFKQDKFKNLCDFDIKKDFEKSEDDFLFEFVNNLGFSFLSSNSKNKENYTESKLNKTPLTSFNIDFISTFNASSQINIFDNKLTINYYLTNNNEEGYEENKDLINYIFNYKNKYFKINKKSFFIPLPYFEIKTETEFDKPEENKYHNLKTSASAGISLLSIDEKFEVKGGASVTNQLLSDEKSVYGFVIGYLLKPYQIEILKVPFIFESQFDYFGTLDIQNGKDLRIGSGLFKVYIPFFENFYFNLKAETYIYKEDDKDWSYTRDFLFGVNFLFNKWI